METGIVVRRTERSVRYGCLERKPAKMYRLLSCSWCIGTLLVAVMTRGTVALHDDRYEIHRVEKEHHALRRRDGICTTGHTACAANAGGGCCPSYYACAQTYCYATTAGPTSACGTVGLYNCPLDSGPGGCCPVGFICGPKTCTPSAGVTQSCPVSYSSCPASLGGGCCPNGMGCAILGCYSTEASTYTVSVPVTTTDSDGSTVTSVATETTIITPTPPSRTTAAAGAAKLVPSTVSKLRPMETSSNGGGGALSRAELGGIIAGVIIVLIAVVVAAFIIIRRLNKTAKVVEESKRGSSGGNRTKTSSHKPTSYVPTTTVTEVDGKDIDPLMQTPSIRPSQLHGGSESGNSRNQSPARSPPLGSDRSTPPAWPGYYNPMPSAELESVRHSSIESGYYDPSRFSQQTGSSGAMHRVSYDSQYTQQQMRHWSNASEVSGSADGAHGFSELSAGDAAAGGRRRSSSGATNRPPLTHSMKGSGDAQQHQRGRSDSSTVGATLGTVSEIGELHGFYGPADRQMGQTGARLEREDSK